MQNTIEICYPKINIGTVKSTINFFDDEPNLVKLFYSEDSVASQPASLGTPTDASATSKPARAQSDTTSEPTSASSHPSASATSKPVRTQSDTTSEPTNANPSDSATSQPSERRLFITDTNVASLSCMDNFLKLFNVKNSKKPAVYNYKSDALIIVKSGEKYKTFDTVLQIVKAALDASLNRKDLFVGIGGGVITDITGFACSMFKRGARCAFVPTTLLAMVDASIGGKTGCDYKDYKNMTGAFYPAENLYVYPKFVLSQSNAEYRSGLAESFKNSILFNPDLYNNMISNKDKIQNRNIDFLFYMIQECMKDKAKIVEEDFTEKNIRMFLNLGHTFGHALETCVGLGKMKHGDAVAWGIGRALCVSKNLNLCSEDYFNEIIKALDSFGWCTSSLPKNFKLNADNVLNAMKKDKKNSSSTIRLILQKELSSNVILEIDDKEILKALS